MEGTSRKVLSLEVTKSPGSFAPFRAIVYRKALSYKVTWRVPVLTVCFNTLGSRRVCFLACRTEKERKGKEAGLGGIAEAGKVGCKKKIAEVTQNTPHSHCPATTSPMMVHKEASKDSIARNRL